MPGPLCRVRGGDVGEAAERADDRDDLRRSEVVAAGDTEIRRMTPAAAAGSSATALHGRGNGSVASSGVFRFEEGARAGDGGGQRGALTGVRRFR